MKKYDWVRVAFMLALVVILQSAMSAQPQMRMSPEERTAELKKQLSLTDEQAANVLAIYETQRKEMQALFAESDGDRMAMREAMLQKTKESDDKISDLLNDEQKEKFIELQKQRRNRLEQRRKDRE